MTRINRDAMAMHDEMVQGGPKASGTFSQIVEMVVTKRVTNLSITGGFGKTFGAWLDDRIYRALYGKETITSVTVTIRPEDWEMLENAFERNQDPNEYSAHETE